LEGGITRGDGRTEGAVPGFATEIDKYTLVLLRRTQKAPGSATKVDGSVRVLNPVFVM
jgi:hypothetical protein